MRKIIPTVGIIVFLLYIFLLSSLFQIKKGLSDNSTCLGNDFLEKTNLKNKNMFLVSTSSIKKSVLNNFPCAADLTIQKRYPSTILINVSAIKTVLKIDGTDLALSENNIVTKNTSTNVTPTFFPPQGIKFAEGQKVTDQTALFVISLAADIQKSDFIISNIRIVEGDLIAVYSRDESVAIFSRHKDVKEQVDSLQAILAKAKIDSSKIEKIDLRFDKPILTIKQKQE